MNAAIRCCLKPAVYLLLIGMAILVPALPSHAYFYSGGDWGGRDLSLSNGDTLSGSFTNIGIFSIVTGSNVSGLSDMLSISAGRVLIEGGLFGNSANDLFLKSNTDLYLSGTLANWKNISLTSNTQLTLTDTALITLTDTALIQSTGSGSTPPGAPPSGSGCVLTDGRFDRRTLQDPVVIRSYKPITDILLDNYVLLDNSAGGQISIIPTPIPAAAWLLGSGLICLARIRRRVI